MNSQQGEKERRKAEVRARLEAQARQKKKRGFMTPERKKRLRNLLRQKAAQELKREQERKAAERRRIIKERCGQPKLLEGINEAALQSIVKEYHKRICSLESQKFDMEIATSIKEYEINDLMTKVNDSRGKFIIPPLKRVPKTANQLEKIRLFTARIAQNDYRTSLKQVKKKEFEIEESKSKVDSKPEWAIKSKTASVSEAALSEGEE